MLLYLFFDSLLSTCPRKMETEKWPKAADSSLLWWVTAYHFSETVEMPDYWMVERIDTRFPHVPSVLVQMRYNIRESHSQERNCWREGCGRKRKKGKNGVGYVWGNRHIDKNIVRIKKKKKYNIFCTELKSILFFVSWASYDFQNPNIR